MNEEFPPYQPGFDDPYLPPDAKIERFEYKDNLRIMRARNAVAMDGGVEADYIVAAPYYVALTVDARRTRSPCRRV